jgi:hypothetical protein
MGDPGGDGGSGPPAEVARGDTEGLRTRLVAAEAELLRLRTILGAGDPADPDGLARQLAELKAASRARRRDLSELLAVLGDRIDHLA